MNSAAIHGVACNRCRPSGLPSQFCGQPATFKTYDCTADTLIFEPNAEPWRRLHLSTVTNFWLGATCIAVAKRLAARIPAPKSCV